MARQKFEDLTILSWIVLIPVMIGLFIIDLQGRDALRALGLTLVLAVPAVLIKAAMDRNWVNSLAAIAIVAAAVYLKVWIAFFAAAVAAMIIAIVYLAGRVIR